MWNTDSEKKRNRSENDLAPVKNLTMEGCEAYLEDGDHDLERLADPDKQLLIPKREEVLDVFRSLKEGKGSSFVPDEEYIKIYDSIGD
jgi:hypothetical protein